MGIDEIAVFAAQYCYERNRIGNCIYLNVTTMIQQEMLDDLNKKLSLDVHYTEVKSKYCKNLTEQMNLKFSKED